MLTVLHADDDNLILSLVKAILEISDEFSVSNYSSGFDAIKHGSSYAYDLIILDFQMPGMTGVETLYSLKKIPLLAGTPVIFLTSDVEREEIHNAREVDIIGIIAKPFNPDKLLDEVKHLYMKYKNSLNENKQIPR